MRESTLEKWARKKAKDLGWWCRKFKSPGKRSAPDRIFAKGGVVFFIEFKATRKKATKLQLQEHKEMRDVKLRVHVVDNKDDFLFYLEAYDPACA